MSEFTFHYVSITSSSTGGGAEFSYNIYIPLCFYYIPDGRLEAWIPEQIYIPLCFYYIKISFAKSNFNIQNLHSTMFLLHLPAGRVQYTIPPIFTFHYVSITSPCRVKTPGMDSDLHSTMFLLHQNEN